MTNDEIFVSTKEMLMNEIAKLPTSELESFAKNVYTIKKDKAISLESEINYLKEQLERTNDPDIKKNIECEEETLKETKEILDYLGCFFNTEEFE